MALANLDIVEREDLNGHVRGTSDLFRSQLERLYDRPIVGVAFAAVVFQAELAFQGGVDRFDDLTERLELCRATSSRFVAAGRADEFDPVFSESGLELG